MDLLIDALGAFFGSRLSTGWKIVGILLLANAGLIGVALWASM